MNPQQVGRLRGGFLYEGWTARQHRRRFARWLSSGQGVPLPHLAKRQLLADHAERFRLELMVETGTYHGDMVHGLRDNFRSLHSIELSERLHLMARGRLEKHPRIHLHQGDSARVLPELLATVIDAPTLFWLDGHWSAGGTARGEKDTPVGEELEAVLAHPVAGHVILIDDARHFTGENDYPTLEAVRERILATHPTWEVSVADDIIRAHRPEQA